MSGKLLWSGLTLLVAFNPLFRVLGVRGADIFELVGAVLMVIGMVLMWLDK